MSCKVSLRPVGIPLRADSVLSTSCYPLTLTIMDPLAVTSTPPAPEQAPEHALTPADADLGRLEGIIRSAMEAIITIDESQRILIFNPMAEKLFGCAAADAIGGSLERFIPIRNRPGHSEKVRQFGVTGASERQLGRQRPLFGLRANGEEFPIEASISQLVDQKGRLFTVMLRDVTDRLKAEAELNASRNELRALSANLQTAREEEKARIARELHDDLGQRLTALKMDLALLESELDEHPAASALSLEGAVSPEAWRRHTHAMRALLDDTVQAVRRIAADLRPVMLDDLGLMAAIDWLANEWRSRYGIIVTLEADPDAWNAVEPNAATAIFRIVQEALTNIARHANATRATVHLSRCATGTSNLLERDDAARTDAHRLETGICVLRISDNGTGAVGKRVDKDAGVQPEMAQDAATQAGDLHQPFGLIGMRERVRMLEGTLTIEQPSGGGFVVHVTLPLSMVDAADGHRRAPHFAQPQPQPQPSVPVQDSLVIQRGKPAL